MAYKISLSKSGSRKQMASTKTDVFISKEQAKEINKLAKEKNVTGVVVYLENK